MQHPDAAEDWMEVAGEDLTAAMLVTTAVWASRIGALDGSNLID